MIKNITKETINTIKDGAVVELGANAKIEHKGKSVVLTINGKEYIYRDGDYTTEKLIEYINLEIDYFTTQAIDKESVVDTIKNYLDNYLPSYLDGFGECVITVYWGEFTEELKEMLIENVAFANSVRDMLLDNGVIEKRSDFAVCDDGVYVTVDYDKFFLNEIKKDANFIVNAYIDNFQSVVYDEYNYPYPEYGCTEEQYAEMVAAMKKDFEEILNNFKDVVEVFLKTYKEYEDVGMDEYPNEKHRAYFIVEDIDLSIGYLFYYHNGKKDGEVLRNLTETYVRCNKYIS